MRPNEASPIGGTSGVLKNLISECADFAAAAGGLGVAQSGVHGAFVNYVVVRIVG